MSQGASEYTVDYLVPMDPCCWKNKAMSKWVADQHMLNYMTDL